MGAGAVRGHGPGRRIRESYSQRFSGRNRVFAEHLPAVHGRGVVGCCRSLGPSWKTQSISSHPETKRPAKELSAPNIKHAQDRTKGGQP